MSDFTMAYRLDRIFFWSGLMNAGRCLIMQLLSGVAWKLCYLNGAWGPKYEGACQELVRVMRCANSYTN